MPKTKLNIVEMIADEDDEQAFDQPCLHGNRLGSHAVYCHSEKADLFKCLYRWSSQRAHEENECGDYTPNPAWDADGEEEARRRENDDG